jgi:nucleotide sugar dehydrogenase
MISQNLIGKIASRKATVAVVGLGYVGLPLSLAFEKAGFPVLGFDVDAAKIDAVNAGRSYIKHISSKKIAAFKAGGGNVTGDPRRLTGADAILICVPTPLTRYREPDLGYVRSVSEMLAPVIRRGQLIVLESTTYPGTTREVILPILEKSGLRWGEDFMLAYSPEREDPGAIGHSTNDIPKVVGGVGPGCRDAAVALYNAIVPHTVPVSSPDAAEATKLLENIFRSVNIALVNELKVIFERMGIDVWEVIEAAKSKPFGFMPFYPGPGLGGHCIPVDPFYLTWKAREYGSSTRFIELAGEINVFMHQYVLERVAGALNDVGKSVKGSRLLLLGMAYKKDVDDTRESPSFKLLEMLETAGAVMEYHDPFVSEIEGGHDGKKRASVPLTKERIRTFDAIIIATDHTEVDYGLLGRTASLIIDTRNVMAGVSNVTATVVKA